MTQRPAALLKFRQRHYQRLRLGLQIAAPYDAGEERHSRRDKRPSTSLTTCVRCLTILGRKLSITGVIDGDEVA